MRHSRFKNSVNYWAGNWSCLIGECGREEWWKVDWHVQLWVKALPFLWALGVGASCLALHRGRKLSDVSLRCLHTPILVRATAGVPALCGTCLYRSQGTLVIPFARHWAQLLLGYQKFCISHPTLLYPQWGMFTLCSCLQEKKIFSPSATLYWNRNRTGVSRKFEEWSLWTLTCLLHN